eukprot:TCONS_00012568-protein
MMKLILGIVFALIASIQADLSWKNCDSKSFIKIDDISPRGEINKDTQLKAKITSTSTYTDANMKAVVEVVVKKDSWFGMITIPKWVMGIVAPIIAAQIPGVKHLSGNKFEVGCEAAKNFLPECPPKVGTYDVGPVDLKKIFEQVKAKGGIAVTYIGSGTYEIKADVTISQTQETLACLELNNLKIKM